MLVGPEIIWISSLGGAFPGRAPLRRFQLPAKEGPEFFEGGEGLGDDGARLLELSVAGSCFGVGRTVVVTNIEL